MMGEEEIGIITQRTMLRADEYNYKLQLIDLTWKKKSGVSPERERKKERERSWFFFFFFGSVFL